MRNREADLIRKVDWITIGLYLFLVVAGLLNIFAAVYNSDAANIFDISQKYGKQLIWIGFAFIFAISILIIDSKIYSALSYPFYIFVMLLLVGVYLIAPEIKGARSWFEIGSFRFQPSEFAKLATSLVVARYLSGYGVKINTFRSIVRVGFLLFVPMALIVMQGDAGSSIVFLALSLVFYREGMSGWILVIGVCVALLFSFSIIFGALPVFIAIAIIGYISFFFIARNERIKPIYHAYIFIAFGLSWAIIHFLKLPVPKITMFISGMAIFLVPAIIYIYKKKSKIIFYLYFLTLTSFAFTYSVNYVFENVLEAHQKSRLHVFFGMESDPLGLEFNVNQSKIAIGSGDMFGKGFLQGTQTKNNFVPEQSTDFIFCTVGEEWGFVGSSVVIILFVILLLRIMFLAEKQRSLFSKIYGYCVVSVIFFHLLINVGMTIGLMPVIGIPLPFFSYGGSSLWGFTMLLFIFIKLDSDRDVLIQ